MRDGLYNLGGAILRAIISFTLIPALFRNLGTETYGLWVLISAIVGASMLAEGGLAASATYFISRATTGDVDRDLRNTIWAVVTAATLLALIAAAILWLGATSIFGFFHNLDTLQRAEGAKALRVGALCVVALLLINVSVALLHGLQRFDLSNIITTTQLFATGVGYVVISATGGTVIQMMAWQLVVAICALFVSTCVVRRLLAPYDTSPRAADYGRVCEIWKHSVQVWVGTVGGVMFMQFDRIIVGKILGTHTLAVYGVITGIVRQINTLTAMPVQPLLPQLGRMLQSKLASAEVRELIRRSLQVNTVGALGLGGILFTSAPLIMRVVLGQVPTSEQILSLRIAVAIYTIFSINGAGYFILLGARGTRAFMIIQLLSGAAALALIALLSPLGLIGAAIGNVGFWGVSGFSILGMRRLGIPLATWTSWIMPVIAGATALMILTIMSPQTFPVLLFVTCLHCGILGLWFCRQQPVLP